MALPEPLSRSGTPKSVDLLAYGTGPDPRDCDGPVHEWSVRRPDGRRFNLSTIFGTINETG